MKRYLKSQLTNIKLFSQAPKDFLYSFIYSNKEKVSLKPFNPGSLVTAKKLMKNINKVCPTVKLYLIGAVGLKIHGRGDIDLYITSSLNEFSKTESVISKLYGNPKKVRKEFIEWDFRYEGINAEVVLTHPKNKKFIEQIKLFNLLKDNKENLDEYVRLKNTLNNTSEKEYVRKRMEFFNRILSSNIKD